MARATKKREIKRVKSRKTRARSIKPRSRGPFQKATIRSRAFAKAILNAKPYTMDPPRLEQLFRVAAKKVASLRREPFADTWPYLQAMLRLVRAYYRGEYPNVSQGALLSIIAAIAYLVDPLDLIPDEIPFLGFLDDAIVVEFAVLKTRGVLDDFMTWEISALIAGETRKP